MRMRSGTSSSSASRAGRPLTRKFAAKKCASFVITSKRIIAVNVQGITGKKKDFTSLPMAKIQAFSVETAGTFDLDAELELWFSGLGKVKFEFSGKTDVAYLNKLVAHHVL